MKKLFLLIVTTLIMLPVYSASWQIQEARYLYAQGQYNQALKLITDSINSSTYEDVESYKIRADIYIKLNQKVNAINDLTLAINNSNDKSLYLKRANLYLSIEEYEKAFNDFGSSMEKGNGESTRNANIGYIKIAQNVKAPTYVRVQALQMISAIYSHNKKLEDHIAATMKMVQLVILAPENDVVFVKVIGMPKNQAIPEMKKIIISTFDNDPVLIEIFEGWYEYTSGNKELGNKIINGAINEYQRRNPNETRRIMLLKNLTNAVKNSIDNGLPNNSL